MIVAVGLLALAIGVTPIIMAPQTTPRNAFEVTALGSEGEADPGDSDFAYLFVLVTYAYRQEGVTGLVQGNFSIYNPFHPGPGILSLQIALVREAPNREGLYEVALSPPVSPGHWVAGPYVCELRVTKGDIWGATLFTITIT